MKRFAAFAITLFCGIAIGLLINDSRGARASRESPEIDIVEKWTRDGVNVTHEEPRGGHQVYRPFRIKYGFVTRDVGPAPGPGQSVTSIVFPSEQIVVHCAESRFGE